MLIFLLESTGIWLMEKRSKSRTSKLNLCPKVEIVSFGSVLYGCYLLDILDVLLGCLCVDVIVNIWMFIYACYVWMCKCANVQNVTMCKTCKIWKLTLVNSTEEGHICRPPYGARVLSYPNNSFLPGGGLLMSHLSTRGWLLGIRVVDGRCNQGATPVKGIFWGAGLLCKGCRPLVVRLLFFGRVSRGVFWWQRRRLLFGRAAWRYFGEEEVAEEREHGNEKEGRV